MTFGSVDGPGVGFGVSTIVASESPLAVEKLDPKSAELSAVVLGLPPEVGL